MPVTFAILAVLAILLFSYRQTIKAYPSAGGAYIVTKDNFGLLPAQLAGVALLTDYVLTVAVSHLPGVAAMTSAFPALYPYRVGIAVFFIWFIAWGNLRGVRESGRMFAAPTYFFIVMMVVLLGRRDRARARRRPASDRRLRPMRPARHRRRRPVPRSCTRSPPAARP